MSIQKEYLSPYPLGVKDPHHIWHHACISLYMYEFLFREITLCDETSPTLSVFR